MSSRNNLAAMFMRTGHLEEAETGFLEILEQYREVLGESHPDTLLALNNLGYLYQVQGKNREAEKMLAQAIKGLTKTFGASSPQALQSRTNRGLAIYGLGRPDEAGEILRGVMEDSAGALGPKHRASLIAKMSYAKFLAETEKPVEAIALAEEVMEEGMAIFGITDAQTAEYLDELERMYEEGGQQERIPGLRRNHYDKVLAAAGAGSPSVLPALTSLAGALYQAGRGEEARVVLGEALEELAERQKSGELLAGARKIIELLASLEPSQADGFRLAARLQKSLLQSDWPEEKTIRLVPGHSTWKYWDSAAYPGQEWMAPAYDDSNWEAGPAPLGYGEGGLATTLDFGPDINAKPMAAFFRLQFDLVDAESITRLRCWIRRDDGVAVYLNGQEIVRDLLAPNAGPDAPATEAVAGANEAIPWLHLIAGGKLRAGANTLAVEIHQAAPGSSDLGFDLMLEGLGR